jgi:hypothetical protein
VALFIAFENVADTEEFNANPFEPLAGEMAVTVTGVAGDALTVTVASPGVSPPHPDRQKIASRAAESTPPEIFDLILYLIIREAWLIGSQAPICNLRTPAQKVNKSGGCGEHGQNGRRQRATNQ